MGLLKDSFVLRACILIFLLGIAARSATVTICMNPTTCLGPRVLHQWRPGRVGVRVRVFPRTLVFPVPWHHYNCTTGKTKGDALVLVV
jgi:glycerol uptake facilitator-like aquaporin